MFHSAKKEERIGGVRLRYPVSLEKTEGGRGDHLRALLGEVRRACEGITDTHRVTLETEESEKGFLIKLRADDAERNFLETWSADGLLLSCDER